MPLNQTASVKEKLSWFILLLGFVFAIVFAVVLQKKSPAIEDPIEKGLQAYQKKDYKTAAQTFIRLTREKNKEAMFMLGAMYMGGLGVKKDKTMAMSLYKESADAGFTMAQTTLALIYASDPDFLDKESALIYAREAAFQEDVEAQMMLASWFEQNFFGTPNIPEMLYWYRKAAANGNNDAKLALALFYQQGKYGLHANPYTSKRWFDSIEEQKRFIERFSGQKIPVIQMERPKNP